MLEALIAGNEDRDALADLARGRLRATTATLEEALASRLGRISASPWACNCGIWTN